MKIKHLRFKFFAISLGVATFLLTTAFVANNFVKKNSNESVNYFQSEHEYLNSLRVNPKTGTVTPADYAKALKEVEKFRANNATKTATDFTWENRGPDNLAGRMRTILHVELNGTVYWYAGSVSGGLWRLEEGEQVWSPITSTRDLNISCIHQSTDGTIYIGTGEGYYSENFNLLPGFKGKGIYKSTNGVDFTLIASTKPSADAVNNSEWFYVNRIATANGKLFAGTNTGVKVANLQGEGWALAKTSSGVELIGECTEVVSTNNSVVVFVDGLAYISLNGDPNKFECVSTMHYNGENVVNASMLPRDGIGRITFAFAKSNPNYLYAVAINKEDGTLNNIYCSVKGNNGWTNWTVVGPGGSTYMFYVFEANGLYSTALTVDPDDEKTVYVGGNDMWQGKYVDGSEFYQWTQLTTYQSIYSIAYVPSNHFSYLIDANKDIAIACERGIYKFTASNGRAKSFNLNLTTSMFYTVSSDYYDNVYGGSQGNGSVVVSRDLGLYGKTGYNIHPTISASTGEDYYSCDVGGYSHNSYIYPIGTIVSINGGADIKSGITGTQSLTIYRYDDQIPQNISYWYESGNPVTPMETNASYITPSVLWEDFNYTLSRDSVAFIADKNYAKGDTIIASSKNSDYPIEVILDSALNKDETLMVQDIVASRFFVGVKGSIFMTKEASNFIWDFRNDNPWYTISTDKLIEGEGIEGVEGTPQTMAVSKDANYLFVGTKEGGLYRISNIAAAYDAETANVGTELYGSNTPVANPYCVIATSLINTFPDRIVTSISIHPEDSEIVVVTLGNYGFDDYIYISYNALSQYPTFSKVKSVNSAPIYTSLFVEGVEGNSNMFMVGSDFGIWTTQNVLTAEPVWTEEETSVGELPIFMLKQQNVNTHDGKQLYYNGAEYGHVTNYRAIYAASFGGGIFQCSSLVKSGNDVTAIEEHSATKNNITIYPNPAKDYTNISVTTESNTLVTVSIYNVTGKLVTTMTQRSNADKVTFSVNTSGLQQGTYIVKVDTPNCKSQASKFIVVK